MQQVREIISIVEHWLSKQNERPNQFAVTAPRFVEGEGWEIGVALGKDHRGLISIDAPVDGLTEGKRIAKRVARELHKRDWAEMRGFVDLRRN